MVALDACYESPMERRAAGALLLKMLYEVEIWKLPVLACQGTISTSTHISISHCRYVISQMPLRNSVLPNALKVQSMQFRLCLSPRSHPWGKDAILEFLI